MKKEEKKRTFESEALVLPPLKMVLTENKKDSNTRPSKKANSENIKENVKKIIGKLSMEE